MAKKPITTNTTLLKLKGTPFESATEMKEAEKRILMNEWESIERAKARRLLLKKEENQEVIAPFLNGFQAKFVGQDNTENVVRVYLTKEDRVQVEVDEELKNQDMIGAVEGLVKSMTESFMNGYLTALGLKEDNLFKSAPKKNAQKR